MFGVVCAHVALANNMSPQKNPYYMELVRETPKSECRDFTANGLVFIFKIVCILLEIFWNWKHDIDKWYQRFTVVFCHHRFLNLCTIHGFEGKAQIQNGILVESNHLQIFQVNFLWIILMKTQNLFKIARDQFFLDLLRFISSYCCSMQRFYLKCKMDQCGQIGPTARDCFVVDMAGQICFI